jgi:hypothetical protein
MQIYGREQVMTHTFTYVSSVTCASSLVGTIIVLNTLLSNAVNEFQSLTARDQVPHKSAVTCTQSML